MKHLFEYLAASALYLTCVGVAIRFGFQSIQTGFEDFVIFALSGTAAAFMARYLLDRFGDGIFIKEKG